jgi:hypothetical protein
MSFPISLTHQPRAIPHYPNVPVVTVSELLLPRQGAQGRLARRSAGVAPHNDVPVIRIEKLALNGFRIVASSGNDIRTAPDFWAGNAEGAVVLR